MPCLKDKPISDNPPSILTPSNIPVEVETISEPPLDPPQEHETNPESSAPSSSTLVPETSDPIPDGSDEEEEHPEAQTQALRDYQLARDRVRRVPKDHPQYGYSYIVSYAFAVVSYVEEKEPLCFSEVLKSPNRFLWLREMEEEMFSLNKNKTWILVPKPSEQKLVYCK
ncbi:hypothetical protein M9H77_16398 [Catharanthus roseus]|uniref:Uncharacterized protein n=1 Tax=Catharanthus roseus TaxID=4058 RepID=A0ACC0B1M8_CATRO|nr:hypothetical protein M9H77_16398 [Catharanthus roseus]